VSSSTTPASSASVHCQSAVPWVQKSYTATPSGSSVATASDDGSCASTRCRGSTVDAARCSRNIVPNESRDSRAASDTGWPSRPSPTATLSGDPPGCATNRRSPSATRSTMASPSTVSMIPTLLAHTGGGRSSYGVESTTVVRVETLARARISCSSDSSAPGPPTRTLRM
jgi:hypothetical protein